MLTGEARGERPRGTLKGLTGWNEAFGLAPKGEGETLWILEQENSRTNKAF